MSVFACRLLAHSKARIAPTFARSIVSNPAANSHPAFRNPAVVPFGIEFVDNDLRQQLEAKNVDIDELESLYYKQCQCDAEFNNSRLPSDYDSKLWGFIYGERLVSAKYKLDTLGDDERFLLGQLKAMVTELSMRMDRFYPDFDYKAQVAALVKCDTAAADANTDVYRTAYNEALAQVISQDPQKFISLFANNSFFTSDSDSEPADGQDKFADFLPRNVENELIAKYSLKWDMACDLRSGFDAYFARIGRVEAMVAPRLDSLSQQLRSNFADFVLFSFSTNKVDAIKYVTALVERSTSCIISGNTDEMSSQDLVKSSLRLLDEMSASPLLISKLFFASGSRLISGVDDQVRNNDLSVLSSIDKDRLLLINKSLQIYEYLKYNSMTRLLISCLITQYTDVFYSVLNDNNGDDNISKLESVNADCLDEMVALQSVYFDNGRDLAKSFASLLDAIVKESDGAVCASAQELTCLLDLSQFTAPPCWISSLLESRVESARESGSLADEIKYLTLSKYVSCAGADIGSVALLDALMNPPRNDVCGTYMKAIAYAFTSSASDATTLLLSQIGEIMKSKAMPVSAQLAQSIQPELDNLKSVCKQFDTSRCKLEQSIADLKFDVVDNVNFDHAQSTYDPLSTYLSQIRYYGVR